LFGKTQLARKDPIPRFDGKAKECKYKESNNSEAETASKGNIAEYGGAKRSG
jgi:hypothetical protein